MTVNRPPERPPVRSTGTPMQNNSINRYGKPNVSVLSKVLNLDKLSCPKIWNIEQEKDREKEKVGGRPAKLNEIKG